MVVCVKVNLYNLFSAARRLSLSLSVYQRRRCVVVWVANLFAISLNSWSVSCVVCIYLNENIVLW